MNHPEDKPVRWAVLCIVGALIIGALSGLLHWAALS